LQGRLPFAEQRMHAQQAAPRVAVLALLVDGGAVPAHGFAPGLDGLAAQVGHALLRIGGLRDAVAALDLVGRLGEGESLAFQRVAEAQQRAEVAGGSHLAEQRLGASHVLGAAALLQRPGEDQLEFLVVGRELEALHRLARGALE
ncbi:MAG: hypothetical protein ACK56I_15980, partial [bacterium]